MRIGIDIDGVVCDLMEPVLAEINRKFGTEYTKEDITEWNPEGWTAQDGEPIVLAREVRAFLSNRELALTPKPCEYAKAALAVLGSEGDSLVFITSRKDNKDIMEYTAEWVKRNGFGHIPIIHCLDKGRIDFDVLVEDNFDTARDVAEIGRWVILILRPWNQEALFTSPPPRLLAANDWHDVVVGIQFLRKFTNDSREALNKKVTF